MSAGSEDGGHFVKAEVCGNGQEQQFLPLWSEYVICKCVKKLRDGVRIKKNAHK